MNTKILGTSTNQLASEIQERIFSLRNRKVLYGKFIKRIDEKIQQLQGQCPHPRIREVSAYFGSIETERQYYCACCDKRLS